MDFSDLFVPQSVVRSGKFRNKGDVRMRRILLDRLRSHSGEIVLVRALLNQAGISNKRIPDCIACQLVVLQGWTMIEWLVFYTSPSRRTKAIALS